MRRFTRPLARLGNDLEIGEDLLRELEEFTCAIYGNSRFTSVDELRLFKLKDKCEGKPTTAMCNMDMGSLPPCRKCLIQHVRRVNYQLSIWKKLSHSPNEHSCTIRKAWPDSGKIEFWIEGQVLPQRLADILQDTIDADNNEEEEEEDDDDEIYGLVD